MIFEGRVSVHGEVVTDPATSLPDWQGIAVDGNPLSAPPDVQLYRFYKPLGRCCDRPRSRRPQDGL